MMKLGTIFLFGLMVWTALVSAPVQAPTCVETGVGCGTVPEPPFIPTIPAEPRQLKTYFPLILNGPLVTNGR